LGVGIAGREAAYLNQRIEQTRALGSYTE